MKCENCKKNKGAFKCTDEFCESAFCKKCTEAFDYECPYHGRPSLIKIKL